MKQRRLASRRVPGFLIAWASLTASCGGTPTSEPKDPSNAETADVPEGDTNASTNAEPIPPVDDGLIAKLSQAATRAAGVDDLVKRYSAAARNGTKTEPARAFADQYAKAASEAYVAAGDELDDAQRLALVKTLVALEHTETAPAIGHAISRYTTTGSGVEEAILASQAAARLSSAELQESLLATYRTLDTSNADGLRFSRHLAAAMSAQRDDAWNSTFLEVLTETLVRPERFDDKPAVKAFQSGLFRQTIAARLLGESGSKSATIALLRVLLDGHKSEVHPAAELAIIKLKANAVPELLDLLRGEGELVGLARDARKDEKQAHVYFATKWLDLLRLPSTEQDLLDAWGRTKDPVARTLLIRSLSRLPGTKGGLDELKTTYTQTDIKVTLPEGESALETLSDAAVQFFDPELTLWLEARVDRVPTVWTRRGDVQVALVMAMSRLVTADQVKATSPAAVKYGGKPGTPAFETASQLVQSCKSEAACYVKTITSAPTPFGALKAVTMAAVYGDSATRDALIDIALGVEEQELLNQVLIAIEHLTTSDAAQTATAITDKAKPNLDGPSSTWPRGKRAAINATIARLQAR
jgi:hypothetical protein